MSDKTDEYWMKKALELAEKASQKGEVPVGAILVLDNTIIAKAYNSSIQNHDPTAHAEIVALRKAAKKIQNYRLINTTLYVTLEPCLMCVGAMVHARINRLVYGANDPKTGAVESRIRGLELAWLNHKIHHQSDILSLESGALLKQFFKERRQ